MAVFSLPPFTHSSNVPSPASSVLSGLLPVVGNVREYGVPGAAFFIDIVNALVIKLYLMLPIFAG